MNLWVILEIYLHNCGIQGSRHDILLVFFSNIYSMFATLHCSNNIFQLITLNSIGSQLLFSWRPKHSKNHYQNLVFKFSVFSNNCPHIKRHILWISAAHRWANFVIMNSKAQISQLLYCHMRTSEIIKTVPTKKQSHIVAHAVTFCTESL